MPLTLFTLNRHCAQSLDTCLAMMREQDGLLLLEDGVYLGIGRDFSWTPPANDKKLYILTEDLLARGLANTIIPGFNKVDYSGFVGLTLEYNKVLSW